jgi:glycerophosphoryl diester phosphodiesterase
MISHFPTPIIFAHRGASAHAPENTLAAFELAVKQGAPAIEFDVKLTSDRQVIIFHDLTLNTVRKSPHWVKFSMRWEKSCSSTSN